MTINIVDAKAFHLKIEEIVSTKNCSYVDAVLIYQQEANTEYETVASLVKQNPVLKAKVQEDAVALRMVKPSVKKLVF